MKHIVRIDDEQIAKLKEKHPEWNSLDYQSLLDVAIGSITEAKKK